MSTLSLYERMDAISGQMALAAGDGNWEHLTRLEREVAQLRDRLASVDSRTPLNAAERERKVALIHRILDNDAQVRRHTEPWMEHVQTFLGGDIRGRAMRDSYGSVARL